ncbi:MAG: DUF4783 domain-containing protein [Bacteroidota bacterium]
MKKSYIILFIVAAFSGLSFTLTISPSTNEISKDIISALNTGNSKEIAKFFNNTIDLNIPENDGSYSKTQAELILKNFFSKHKVKSFVLNHQGSSNDGSQFIIGTLNTMNGNFRTYCYIKKIGNSLNIQQLQFEKN